MSRLLPSFNCLITDFRSGILIGCVAAFLLIVTLFGPEKHGYEFEKHRAAFEEGGGDDEAMMDDNVLEGRRRTDGDRANAEDRLSADGASSDEKGREEMVERV